MIDLRQHTHNEAVCSILLWRALTDLTDLKIVNRVFLSVFNQG
jgi:hypothetical protein